MEKNPCTNKKSCFEALYERFVRTRLSGLVRSIERRREHVQGFAENLRGVERGNSKSESLSPIEFRTTHAILLGGGHSRQIENLSILRGILDLNRFRRVLRSRTSKLFRHGRSVCGLACTVCLERHCTGIVLALDCSSHSPALPQRFLPRRIGVGQAWNRCCCSKDVVRHMNTYY